ncbi:hypothetical protein EVAR_21427_1 [Eumeta japonica]|uniref:Uncharacterized protein n=1 Tax=Eumeta variegata TaxID=151549 RepID=A0A4C1VHR1_EUMVA|nr:hypothetical protein EVAR_21427_1 [Eumeta japonica]
MDSVREVALYIFTEAIHHGSTGGFVCDVTLNFSGYLSPGGADGRAVGVFGAISAAPPRRSPARCVHTSYN